VITHELALELARRGLPWKPASGDRFYVPDRDLDDEVFVVSGMSIEVSDLPSGTEMRFNGTVEWALDSIAQTEVVWLPREEQMREALGEEFLRLERLDAETGGYAVVLRAPASPRDGAGPAAGPGVGPVVGPATAEQRHVDIDAERAYARALLSVLGG
jgi:hypothetical protein